jgi:hypothetical protein
MNDILPQQDELRPVLPTIEGNVRVASNQMTPERWVGSVFGRVVAS